MKMFASFSNLAILSHLSSDDITNDHQPVKSVQEMDDPRIGEEENERRVGEENEIRIERKEMEKRRAGNVIMDHTLLTIR